MSERPYVCTSGHQLSHGVSTCPRCGAAAAPARRELSLAFAAGLVALAAVGIGATIIGGGDGPARSDEAAAAATEAPSTTTDVTVAWATTAPAETTTTEAEAAPATTTTTSRPATTTTVATTTTTPVPTTAPRRTVPAQVNIPPPVTTPPVTTPPAPTAPTTPSPAAQHDIARRAVASAHTSGHPGATTLFAPSLRGDLDRITTRAPYRQAGCDQRVAEVADGPVDGSRYSFSVRVEHTCDRVPRNGDGAALPLITGAYSTVTLGPNGGNSSWAVALSSN